MIECFALKLNIIFYHTNDNATKDHMMRICVTNFKNISKDFPEIFHSAMVFHFNYLHSFRRVIVLTSPIFIVRF